MPHGLEEGTAVELPSQELALVVGEPTEFRFLSSTTRREDHPGLLLDSWSTDEIEELAPLHTTLEWSGHEGAVIPVHLEADVNELGILELRCVSRDGQRWKLEFNVRS